MTVSAAVPSITYTANGVATVYAYPFKTFSASHLVATLDGVTVTNYTVSGLGADGGGNLTFSPAPLGELVIRRVLPLSRSADYQEGGAFREDQVDQDQDIQTQQIQQIAEESGRALKLAPGNSAPANLEPTPNTFPAFDAVGNLINALLQTGTSLVDLAGEAGAALVGFIQPYVGAIKRTVELKLFEQVTVTDFGGVDLTGATDSTAGIINAVTSGAKRVKAPAGTYLITSMIDIPNFVTLYGDGFATGTGQAPTRFLKRGNFTGVRVNTASQLRDLSIDGDTGNGGDGVQVLGSRSVLDNVSCIGHGRDGFHIGGYSTDTYGTTNTNLWRANNIIARSNTRHGCLIQHEGAGATPNNNAGTLLGFDGGFNGGDGLKVTESYDNQLLGVTCQNNAGYGVHLSTQAKGNYIPSPYLEANTTSDLILDAGADRNIVIGARGGVTNDGYINNGADNIVVGRYGSLSTVPLHSAPEGFEDLRVIERTTSGYWRVRKEITTRNLLVELVTSATADLLVRNTGGGVAGLRFATGTGTAALRGIITGGGTLNFGNIPAASSVDVAVAITGADNTYAYNATPIFAIPANVTWAVYWDAGASTIKVRCTNATAGIINVNGAFLVTGQKIV